MSEELDQERVRQATMLFAAVNRRHRKVFGKFVSKTGLTNSQHRLLMHLNCTNCAPSQTELARTFEVSSAAIAFSLKNLEKNGYIRRCAAVEDSRYNEIALTEKGQELVQQTHSYFTSADVAMFASFSPDELESFVICLEKMKTALLEMENSEQDIPRLPGIHVREILAGMCKDRQ